MNEYDRLYEMSKSLKRQYPAGTRVMLLSMGDDPNPVEDNTRGTVVGVDDIGTVHCRFDNGRSLGLIRGEDSFRRLTAAELAEEQKQTSSDPDEDDPDEKQSIGMNM